jgi:hypothetical protein
MKYFIQVSLITYIATMLVYTLWSSITFATLDKGWIGSLVYLPHGCRVIFYCFFGARSLPALYAAEITGPTLVWGDQYLDYWAVASISSLLSVVVAVEIVKWSRVSTFNYNILKKVNFANYKFLIFVIIISALFNSIFTNLILSVINGVNIGVEVIARFFIGDVLGSVAFIIFLMILFNLLQQRRLYKVHED